jgi:hypothetical protein
MSHGVDCVTGTTSRCSQLEAKDEYSSIDRCALLGIGYRVIGDRDTGQRCSSGDSEATREPGCPTTPEYEACPQLRVTLYYSKAKEGDK